MYDGWLPDTFDGMKIKTRTPFTLAAEQVVAAGAQNFQFPSGVFILGTDRPFEIHEMILVACQSVGNPPFTPIADPAPGIDNFWRIRLKALNLAEDLTQNAQLVATLKDLNTGNWPWPKKPNPMTLKRAQGFTVGVDNLLPANFLRAQITFRGALLVTELANDRKP